MAVTFNDCNVALNNAEERMYWEQLNSFAFFQMLKAMKREQNDQQPEKKLSQMTKNDMTMINTRETP